LPRIIPMSMRDNGSRSIWHAVQASLPRGQGAGRFIVARASVDGITKAAIAEDEKFHKGKSVHNTIPAVP
jgi:hypothetical protein